MGGCQHSDRYRITRLSFRMPIFFLSTAAECGSVADLSMKKRLHREHPIKGLQSLLSFSDGGVFEGVFLQLLLDSIFLQDFFKLQEDLSDCIAATSGSITRKHTMPKNMNAAIFIYPKYRGLSNWLLASVHKNDRRHSALKK